MTTTTNETTATPIHTDSYVLNGVPIRSAWYTDAAAADAALAEVPDNCRADRARHVESLLRSTGKALHVFKINPATGEPAHPLYLRETLKPQPWKEG